MKRLFPLLILACGGDTKPPPKTTDTTTTTADAMAMAATDASVAMADAATAPQGPTSVAKWSGMSTPESVIYDEANDRYLVSNINGNPSESDGNGFISELTPDGKASNMKWIEGGKNKVKLDAPKGTAIGNGTYFVADITVVRKFDLKTGAPKGEIKIPNASFLNQMTSGPDGTVYVSDTGIKISKTGGIEQTGNAAVYSINEKAKQIVTTLAKGPDLHGPNGVLWTDKGIIVVSFEVGTPELFRLDDKGKKQDVTRTPKGSLDGIVQMGDWLLVSSWDCKCVYKGKLGGTFEVAIPNLEAPADIGWDKKRSRLLVPRFNDNAVESYEIK